MGYAPMYQVGKCLELCNMGVYGLLELWGTTESTVDLIVAKVEAS
jgi:hypothetical protein